MSVSCGNSRLACWYLESKLCKALPIPRWRASGLTMHMSHTIISNMCFTDNIHTSICSRAERQNISCHVYKQNRHTNHVFSNRFLSFVCHLTYGNNRFWQGLSAYTVTCTASSQQTWIYMHPGQLQAHSLQTYVKTPIWPCLPF